MIYVTGSNGTIGRALKEKIQVVPITFREKIPEVIFEPNSTLIHLSTSITTRNSIEYYKESFESDIYIPFELFKKYLNSNPNGKIIFLSSSGDLHSQTSISDDISTEHSNVEPKTLYGTHKLLLENYLNLLHKEYPNFKSIIFRVSNVYGGDSTSTKVNGLIDKLLNSNDKIEIYSNLESTINIIHIQDLINLIIKTIYKEMGKGHYLFLVGNENYKISEILDLISEFKKLNLTIKEDKNNYTYINIDCTKVKNYFHWSCEKFLYNLLQR